PAAGSLNDDFTSLGLIMPAGLDTAQDNALFYLAYAAVPESSSDVVFAESPLPIQGSDLDNQQFARVFRRHGATLDPGTARENVAGFGIGWGIWERSGSSGVAAWLNDNDLLDVQDDFNNLVWAVID